MWREKRGAPISGEIQGLFENYTIDPSERQLPADEILLVKLSLKTKLNSYGGLDKLKERVCLIGNMQIEEVVKVGMRHWMSS